MQEIPTLITQRLKLRPHRAADLDAVHTMWCEPSVYEFISGKPATREESWEGIQRHIGQWHMSGFGFWVIEDRLNGQFIGEAGFLDCRRDIIPAIVGPEAGWALCPAFHRKGFAQEALTEILAWGDQHTADDTFTCIVSPANASSLKLAAKLGFIETAQTTYKNDPTIVLQRTRTAS